MKTHSSHNRWFFWGAVLVLAVMAGLAVGTHSSAAQAPIPAPDCGDLPECGYIQMHSGQPWTPVKGQSIVVTGRSLALADLPPCAKQLVECDYIRMHSAQAVQLAARMGIPPTGGYLHQADIPACGRLVECEYIQMHSR